MVVQHNLTAINANRYLGINNNKLSKSLEKLSSGYQINRAGDNASGLAVSEKMRSQIAGMKQGVKNAQDGISMVQTFEGALTETHSILQRMKTLADQMANGSYDTEVDRNAAQLEFDQLNDELNQIADTDFNGVCVLNGGYSAKGTQLAAADGVAVTPKAKQLGSADMTITDDDAYTGTSGKVMFTAVKNADNSISWRTDGGETLNTNASSTGFKYKGVTVTLNDAAVEGTTVSISFKAAVDASSTGSGSTVADVTVATDGTDTDTTTTSGNNINKVYSYNSTTKTWESADGDTLTLGTDGALVGGENYTKNVDGIDFKITNGDAINAKVPTEGQTITLAFTSHKDSSASVINPEAGASIADAYNNGIDRTAQMVYTDNITLQVGARSKDAVKFTFKYTSDGIGTLKNDLNCTADGLGTSKLSLQSQASANDAIDKIDNAISKVSMVRSTFGAIQNRLEHKIDNMNVSIENLTSAESQIRDTNMPEEMMEFTKNQILAQAAQSMLAQANQIPQGVLSLLQ